jgi:hypothetical protein
MYGPHKSASQTVVEYKDKAAKLQEKSSNHELSEYILVDQRSGEMPTYDPTNYTYIQNPLNAAQKAFYQGSLI